jgi:hypothetical protein
VSAKQLRQLAKAIFKLTRREIWLGGKAEYRGVGADWPKTVEKQDWSSGVTWTLSPEVELGGHQMRVCVSWGGGEWHRVRVFTDGKLVHPGGEYQSSWWPWGWSWRIAKQERAEGGKTGPVDRRDLLLKEAASKGRGVVTQHVDPLYCDSCDDALHEVERVAEPFAAEALRKARQGTKA